MSSSASIRTPILTTSPSSTSTANNLLLKNCWRSDPVTGRSSPSSPTSAWSPEWASKEPAVMGGELSRVLRTAGLPVHEVNRPNRQARRLRGKSDPLDAYQAAESVLAERGTSTPKTKDGPVECLRVLRVLRAARSSQLAARSSAMKARTISINQIKGILVSAPEHVRSRFRALTSAQLIPALERSRSVGNLTDQLDDIQSLKADAEQRGWDSEAARHATTAAALTTHLHQLRR